MSKSIIVDNISKKFEINHQLDNKRSSLFSKFVKGESNDAKSETFWALKNISFEVEQGERLAIVGRNGAGKSTLLKILSRVMSPTEGKISVRGRLSSLLEVGTGFHPELTGRENVYLNGALLGMSREEVKHKFDAIVDFAEVERFLDTPVKRYSSGMYVRLAFAVSAFLEPDIVVLDEVLSVGDSRFQKKSYQKIRELALFGRTVIFVTHSAGAVRSLCSKALLLENGEIRDYGSVEDIIQTYEHQPKPFNGIGKVKLDNWKDREGAGELVRVMSGEIESYDKKNVIHIGDMLRFNFSVQFSDKLLGENIKMSLVLRTDDGYPIANMVTDDSGFDFKVVKDEEIFSIQMEEVVLYPGYYNVGFWVGNMKSETYDYVIDCMSFEVVSGGDVVKRCLPRGAGLLYLRPKWDRL